MGYAEKIHAALVSAAMAHNFPTITYPKGVRTCGIAVVKAKTVLARQDGQLFSTPTSNRRTFKRERGPWTWILDLRFDKAVSLEAFEDALIESPIRIERDPDKDLPDQFVLLLEEASYQQAVTQQAAMGDRVLYRFIAQTSPT